MLKSDCYIVIPARYASTRLPGKPLADICGKPMFQHVYERAIACRSAKQVWLATDDQRILSAAEERNIPCILTSPDHICGTDRISEAAEKLGLSPEAVIANVQGDEPLLEPAMLDELLAPFLEAAPGTVQISTLARPLDPADPAEATLFASPNQVKVVCDNAGRALYFSRAPIPYPRSGHTSGPVFGMAHVGMYAYTGEVLRKITRLPPSRLEQIEMLEQLRWLENGFSIHVRLTMFASISVDTLEDLEKARTALAATVQDYNKKS